MEMFVKKNLPQICGIFSRLKVASIAALLGLAVPIAAEAQAVDFSGQTIEFMVPAGPGSGADVYARALAPHIVRHLPGQPNFQVRNVPGGGTITASNEFDARAEPDGLTVMSASSSQVVNYVLGAPNVAYDLSQWRPFMVSSQGIAIYAASSLGISVPEDMASLQDQRLVYGGSGPTAADLRLILSFDMLGWDTNNVWGTDRGNARLAFERGEFNLSYDSTAAYKRDAQPLIDRGLAVPLFSFGVRNDDGSFARDPNFPDLPSFVEAYEMVNGEAPSGPAFDAWVANFGMAMALNKFFALPAGTPDDIVAAFSEAAEMMMADPEAADAVEMALEGYPQTFGAPAEAVMQEFINVDSATIDWIDGWLQENEGVSLR